MGEYEKDVDQIDDSPGVGVNGTRLDHVVEGIDTVEFDQTEAT